MREGLFDRVISFNDDTILYSNCPSVTDLWVYGPCFTYIIATVERHRAVKHCTWTDGRGSVIAKPRQSESVFMVISADMLLLARVCSTLRTIFRVLRRAFFHLSARIYSILISFVCMLVSVV